MFTNEIKKGMEIKSIQLGTPCLGIMMDNMKGNTRLIDCKGSTVGMFDEMGSIYSHDIVQVKVDGEWTVVRHTDKQLKLKKQLESLGF